MNAGRAITLEQARARYPHRYTLEHLPQWARAARVDGTYYAPQFKSDAEWYERTYFPGEADLSARSRHCRSNCPTWPLGQSLDHPYNVERKA